jgi:hypothetical protein
MPQKIILSSDEMIICPNCQHRFEIAQGITRQTIEGYEQDFDAAIKERTAELRKELEREAERKLEKAFTVQLNKLKEQLTESQQAFTEMRSRVEQVQQEAKAKASADFELEKRMLQQELAEKDGKLKQLRELEISLRQEKSKLEESRRELELELQRKLDEEKKKIEEQIRNTEAERFRLKEAEYQKKIEDAQKANEDLRRKLEQGSQQLQGEVLELELENILRNAFPLDIIEPVRKGARGADVLQTVITRTGQSCGKIIWEAKRAENWSNAWVQKLKDDQQAANAEIAVLVTTTMPKQTTDPFCMFEDIWVVETLIVRPIAETLRVMLIEAHKHKVIGLNKNEKVEALYHYLCSPQFAQKIRAVVNAFTTMRRDLDSERAAMARIWKKREQQIERVTLNMMGMCGELQAIAQESLPQLEDIATLPSPDEDIGASE